MLLLTGRLQGPIEFVTKYQIMLTLYSDITVSLACRFDTIQMKNIKTEDCSVVV